MAPLRQEDDYFFDEYYDKEVFLPKKKVLPKNAPKVSDAKIQKKNVKAKRNLKSNIFLGVTIFAVALTIVLRYAMINNMNMENIKLKKELNSINSINTQLKLSAEKTVNLSEIEEYAKVNLGLQKPQNYQIEYINIDKHDLIDNKIESENKNGIKELFEKIVDFFN